MFAATLQNCFNNNMDECNFPSKLKAGDISSIHKKEDTHVKKNYRPITVLPPVSKVYERLMESQMKQFSLGFLDPLLCGFRENYSAQHALLRFTEKCKIRLDAGECVGAVFMDLSKAVDCLNHEFLIAKLNAYGFSRKALLFIHSYLDKRKQRVKVNGSFSEWKEIDKGVPQGSVLGPPLFNIYINDLLIFVPDIEICNYADDTTLYASDINPSHVIEKLEKNSSTVAEWFKDNCMKLDGDKCHFMTFGDQSNDLAIQIDNNLINESSEEKLLGVTIDKKLSFKPHIKTLYKKASQKLHALSRISCYLSTEQLKKTMRAFILSQFSYCPLVWMFCDKSLNNKINHIHEKALRMACKNNVSDFDTLLIENNTFNY